MENYNYDWKTLAVNVFLAIIVGPGGGALAIEDAVSQKTEEKL